MVEQKSGNKTWIVVGDIHGEVDNFSKIPELAEADAIIVSGDLTNLGGAEEARKVMDVLKKAKLPIYAQIGNMDKPDVDQWLSSLGCNLHGQTIELAPGIAIFGIGGSTPTPFHTPSEFSEEMLAKWLDEEWQTAQKFAHKILVSHNPPKDTPCDDIGNNAHVGSTAVRKFIEERQPDICVCGHIHEGRAKEMIGNTIVINPGTLAEGGYVILRESKGGLSADLCSVK